MQISNVERNRVYTSIRHAGLDPSTYHLAADDAKHFTVVHPASRSHLRLVVKGLRRRRAYVESYIASEPFAGGTYILTDWDRLSSIAEKWAQSMANYERHVKLEEEQARAKEEQARAEEAMPDFWALPPDS